MDVFEIACNIFKYHFVVCLFTCDNIHVLQRYFGLSCTVYKRLQLQINCVFRCIEIKMLIDIKRFEYCKKLD